MKTTDRIPAPRHEKIVAASDEEYVALLNNTSRIPCDTDKDYMARFSTCYESMSGIRVRWDNAADFVTDLKEAGRLIQHGTTYTLLPSIMVTPDAHCHHR